jgi:hypothetical protein
MLNSIKKLAVLARLAVISSLALAVATAQLSNPSSTGLPALPSTVVQPVLPQQTVDITYPTSAGTIWAVHPGMNFQTVLNSANCGDAIVLDAGATFSGNFQVPTRPCSGQILVTSSAIASLQAGVQVQQFQAEYMPTISTPNAGSVLNFAPGASNWYFAGINFTVASGVQGLWNLITLSANATSVTELPHNIVFDRVLVHGNNEMCVRGFLADAVGFGLINSQVYDFDNNYQDTQAILIYNSPGPFLIVNNYLEATGENIMFGGASTTIPGVVPSDITFRLNYVNKLTAWQGAPAPCGGTGQQQCYDIKNHFEVKNAQRILVDSNIFNWDIPQGQGGESALFTPRAQCTQVNGVWSLPCATPQAVANDITVTNNLFENVGAMVSVDGIDGDSPGYSQTGTTGTGMGQSTRVLFRNNLGVNVKGGLAGSIAQSGNWVIDHNTCIGGTANLSQTGQAGGTQAFFGDAPPSTNLAFTYTNNLAWGPISADGDNPYMALMDFPSTANLSYDVFVGDTYPTSCALCGLFGPPYPTADHFFQAFSTATPVSGKPSCANANYPAACYLLDWALVQFTNFNSGVWPGQNLQLLPTSPYHNAASDGSDIGANVPAVLAATAAIPQ